MRWEGREVHIADPLCCTAETYSTVNKYIPIKKEVTSVSFLQRHIERQRILVVYYKGMT